MMRAALLSIAALLLVVGVWPATAEDARYEALLSKLKAGDTAIDYTALRYAYAESDGYDGYGSGPEDARRLMIEAFNGRNCTAALEQALRILEDVYIDIDAHYVAGRCYSETLNLGKSGYHRAVANGLEKSLLESGDGKTPKTAFVVVRLTEEYHVLGIKRLRMRTQSLVHADGHNYDLMQASDEAGNEVALYFQIDRILAGLDRRMKGLGLSE